MPQSRREQTGAQPQEAGDAGHGQDTRLGIMQTPARGEERVLALTPRTKATADEFQTVHCTAASPVEDSTSSLVPLGWANGLRQDTSGTKRGGK